MLGNLLLLQFPRDLCMGESRSVETPPAGSSARRTGRHGGWGGLSMRQDDADCIGGLREGQEGSRLGVPFTLSLLLPLSPSSLPQTGVTSIHFLPAKSVWKADHPLPSLAPHTVPSSAEVQGFWFDLQCVCRWRSFFIHVVPWSNWKSHISAFGRSHEAPGKLWSEAALAGIPVEFIRVQVGLSSSYFWRGFFPTWCNLGNTWRPHWNLQDCIQ